MDFLYIKIHKTKILRFFTGFIRLIIANYVDGEILRII